MKKEIRKYALRIGFPFIAAMTLVLSSSLPVLADNASKLASTLRLIQGEVLSLSSDNLTSDNATIVIRNGNQQQVIIKVDANTKYFMVPAGKATASVVNGNVKAKTEDNKANKSEDKQIQTAELNESVIIANCRNNPSGLDRYGREAQFSDSQVGDRIIAWVRIADNLATKVLIIKPAAIQKVRGTITAVSESSITISPANGSAVTLSWNGSTKFVLQGLISVQSGQYASAVYNRTTMTALTVDVQAVPPASVAGQAN